MAKTTKAESRGKEQRVVAHVLEGRTFDEIARLVGYKSRSGAYDAYTRAIQRDTVRDVELIRDTEIRRIDELLRAMFPQALDGDVKATECVLKLMERRAKYYGGLEMPAVSKVEVENVTPDEFKAFMAGAWEAFSAQSTTKADS